jgi:MFS family permease
LFIDPETPLTAEVMKPIASGVSAPATRDALIATLSQKINAKENMQIWLAIGAIIGTIGAAFFGDLVGRRNAYCLLCALSLASTWLMYILNDHYSNVFLFTGFLAGAFTASFYGWLPLYLPELFSTNVRATGQGFGFNFGRVLAAIGALQTGTLMGQFTKDIDLGGITILSGQPAACSTISLIYVVGMVLIWFAPETKGKPLPA